MLQSICAFLSSFNSYQLQASIDKHSTIGMVFITYNNYNKRKWFIEPFAKFVDNAFA
jgi:hypothetical protein